MKKIDDICVLVQARLGSQRIPGKMLRSFCGTTLVDILFEKLKKLKNFPLTNVRFSAYEEELKEVANKHGIEVYHRSKRANRYLKYTSGMTHFPLNMLF